MGSIQEGQGRSGGIEQGPHRLVVRTSRCGRDNPGSTPGVVILRCMAASQECQCQHTKLGSGARTSRTKLASAHPKNTHFGTDWGAESAQQCPWTAGAHRGPRQQRVKCARYCECVRRPCGLMDKALVFGTKDCRLESCQGHMSDWPRHCHIRQPGIGPLLARGATFECEARGPPCLPRWRGRPPNKREGNARPPPPRAPRLVRDCARIKPIGPSTQHQVTRRVPLVS